MAAKSLAPEPKASPLRLLLLCPSTLSSTTPGPSSSSNQATTKSIPPSPLQNPPLPHSLFPPLLTALTSSSPPPDLPSYSGYTTHTPLALRTQYYGADVSIWVDEVPFHHKTGSDTCIPSKSTKGIDRGGGNVDEDIPTLETYKSILLSEEAREVRDVIGGIILTLPISTSLSAPRGATGTDASSLSRAASSTLEVYEEVLHAITEIRDEVESERGSDVAGILVLTSLPPAIATSTTVSSAELSQDKLEEIVSTWEEGLLERGILGWDVVAWQAPQPSSSPPPSSSSLSNPDKKREGNTGLEKATLQQPPPTNSYGEKQGIPRIIEVLESTDWFATPNDETADLYNNSVEQDLLAGSDFSGSDVDSDVGGNIRINNAIRIGASKEEEQELRREMMGLSLAIRYPELEDSDDADDVEVNEEPEEVPPEGYIMNPVSKAHEKTTSSSSTSPPAAPPVPPAKVSKTTTTTSATTTTDPFNPNNPDFEESDSETDEAINALPNLINQMLAIREQASGMASETEKKRFAKREVERIMREL